MNLEQSDSYKVQIEKNLRRRRGVMLSIVLCGILATLLVALIIIISYQDSVTEKLFLDDQQIDLTGFYIKDDAGDIYVNVEKVAQLLGYDYYTGQYDEFNENTDSCYLENQFERVTLSSGDDFYYKYIDVSTNPVINDTLISVFHEDGYKEKFNIEKGKIVFVNDVIYVPLESMVDMFNMKYTWEEYRHRFYSFNYLINQRIAQIPDYNLLQSTKYENLRALVYDIQVISTSSLEDALYGVITLDGREILGEKYSNIIFTQNSKEFYLTTTDKKNNKTVGIVDITGRTIIAPKEYERISLIDDSNHVYEVGKSSDVGAINQKGETIIFCEYDRLGIENADSFKIDRVENPKLLANKFIPVIKDGKYGLFNLKNELVLNVMYDSLGYVTTSSKTTAGNEQSVLEIPEEVGINGIVVNQNELYGIFDINSESLLLPCVFTKIYAKTKDGKVTYYVEYNGSEVELRTLLIDNGIVKPGKNKKVSDDEKTSKDNNEDMPEEPEIDE